jgi:hypothetical protein
MACVNPISIRGKDRYDNQKKMVVPCGYCHKCRQKYRRDWIFRLQQEAKSHLFMDMLTLTYDDHHIPYGYVNVVDEQTGLIYEEVKRPTLVKRDLQLFIKRLRSFQARYIKDKFKVKIKQQKEKIRYFACGEYGERTGRPHYHVIVFGMLPEVKAQLHKVWDKGFIHPGYQFTDACISYATKYILKNRFNKNPDHPQPEFILMSRRPGIGHRFLGKKNAWQWNITENKPEHATLLVKNNANKMQLMPRYYRDKILPQGVYLDKALQELLDDSVKRYWKEKELAESRGQDHDHYLFEKEKNEYKQFLKKLQNGESIF